MKTVKVQFAKTHLSALISGAENGEEVIISRGDSPAAKLGPVDFTGERELGFVTYDVPQSFFDPLPDDELIQWEQR